MYKLKIICLYFFLLAATIGTSWAETTPIELCRQIESFSRGVKIGTSRSVLLSVVPTKEKLCKPLPMDEQGLSLCRYLSIHSSSEMLAGNIQNIKSCIDGSSNPKAKNTRIGALTGKITVSEPFSTVSNVDIELEYSYRWHSTDTDFVRITVIGVDNSD